MGNDLMLEKKPIKENLTYSDVEILRYALISELDAINTYEMLIETSDNSDIQSVLGDIVKEEKIHFGEIQALLLKLDNVQVDCNVSGSNEVRLLTGNSD